MWAESWNHSLVLPILLLPFFNINTLLIQLLNMKPEIFMNKNQLVNICVDLFFIGWYEFIILNNKYYGFSILDDKQILCRFIGWILLFGNYGWVVELIME